MSAPSTSWKYLAHNPRSSYKQLFLKGTRVREILYGLTVDGSQPLTPEEVAAAYQIPFGAVHEAIAYCQANPPEIALDHQGEERVMQATGMNAPDNKMGGKYILLSPQDRARMGL